jgi:transposase
MVHSAGIQDRVGARAVLMRLFCRFDTLSTVLVDAGYTGKLIDWAKQMADYKVEVVKRSDQHTSKVLPKRWIVERTFSWLNWSRRLSKDYELRHASTETMNLYRLRTTTAQKVKLAFRQVLRAHDPMAPDTCRHCGNWSRLSSFSTLSPKIIAPFYDVHLEENNRSRPKRIWEA